jgi:small subunit ribosomal protein S9
LENATIATGKRKTAIASVILKTGTGKRIVNGSTFKDYIKSETLIIDMERPLQVLQSSETFDVTVRVRGGGLSGQAGAIRLGIAKALAKLTEENHKQMRKNGFLTRDSRKVERKKYGLSGARKRYQFSKR